MASRETEASGDAGKAGMRLGVPAAARVSARTTIRRASSILKPSGDNGFKIELARRIVVRALTLAAAGTPKRVPALPASPLASVSRDVIHA